jgi:hypothetical protein
MAPGKHSHSKKRNGSIERKDWIKLAGEILNPIALWQASRHVVEGCEFPRV